MVIDREKDMSSAPVNLPQNPNDILDQQETNFFKLVQFKLEKSNFTRMKPIVPYLFPEEHGRIIYWHMGRRRNAKAIVAITVEKLVTH